MSAFFSWQHAILKAPLEPTTKHVCLTIGCHMAMDGSGCFPSYATISAESGLARSTVISHLAKAVEAGYLEPEARQRKDGGDTSNIYRPCWGPAGGPGESGNRTGGVRQMHPN